MITRRGFLQGMIAAPAVVLTSGALMPVKAWRELPVFKGDGVWDDQPALQAAIDGKPFEAMGGLLSRQGNYISVASHVHVRIDRPIELGGESVGMEINLNNVNISAPPGEALFSAQSSRGRWYPSAHHWRIHG